MKSIVQTLFLITSLSTAALAGASGVEDLRQEVESLRREIAAKNSTSDKLINKPIAAHYSERDLSVTTKTEKLYVGGLLQVWYYSIQNDNRGLFDSPNGTGIADTNEASDNDGLRIRRAELNLAMPIHKHVTAYMMFDFAYDQNTLPFMPSNQNYRTANYLNPEFSAANGVFGNTQPVSKVQNGSGVTPTVLQDALLNFSGIVPHHDFSVGQYMYPFSLEQFAPNGSLDFVERSVIGNSFGREQGLTIHGTWWNNGGGCCYLGLFDAGRFQYWLSVFNGAGNYHQTTGLSLGRSDDNDEKDYQATVLVRPVWGDQTWGNLELAWSTVTGIHGESGGADPIAAPVNGLNRNQVQAWRHQSWIHYRPGGPAKGLWLKSEAQWIKDRNAPMRVADLTFNDALGIGFQTNGNSYWRRGFYVSAGYHLGQSVFKERCGPLKNLEFACRYEQFETIYTADPANPARTNAHLTKVFTPGINYYIKGHEAKIQMNYNFVDNPDGNSAAPFHNVRNDSLVINYQLAF